MQLTGSKTMEVTGAEFVISDTHFRHKNIVKFCKRPQHHDYLMLDCWYSGVTEDDVVIHLGDLFMGKGAKEFAAKVLPQLPGKKYLLPGNHDTESWKFYENLGFEVIGVAEKGQPTSRIYFPWDNKRVLLSHYPDCLIRDWDINIHGHIHNTGYAIGTPHLDYRNVCVEVMDYRPQRLVDVLENGIYQSRKDAGDWPLSLMIEMDAKGRISKNFCEIERFSN